jgi:hypothetical protein
MIPDFDGNRTLYFFEDYVCATCHAPAGYMFYYISLGNDGLKAGRYNIELVVPDYCHNCGEKHDSFSDHKAK